MSAKKNAFAPYFMWFLPLSFFAYQFILRLWPGLMMQNIMAQFAIEASGFGTLAAFYYYGYASMQIPTAMLLDRFGTRLIIGFFALVCGLSTLCFTYTQNFYVALASRFLVGAGSAVGFLGVSKVISEWFPKEHYARMVGLSFTFGLLGAIYGGKPVYLLIEKYGWQEVAVTLSIISIVIGLTSYVFLHSPQGHVQQTEPTTTLRWADFKILIRSPVMWSLALANLLMVGALEGFADVWGVRYLMQTFTLNKGDAAGLISFIFLGMLVGGPLLAFFAKKYGNYKVIAASGLGLALSFVLLLKQSFYNSYMLIALFFVVGIFCCYQVIVFAAGADWVSPQQLGVTVALLNGMNMLGGSFFHTLIGWIMDWLCSGNQAVDGIKNYDLTAYKYSLSIIPICATIGVILIWLIGFHVRKRA